MLQAHAKGLNFLQRIIDLIIVCGVWFAVYFFRFEYFDGSPGPQFIFEKAALLLVGVSAVFFAVEGLYESMRLATRGQEIYSTVKANLKALLVFIVLLYLVSNYHLSRAVIVGYWLISTLALVSFRMAVRLVLGAVRAKGKNLRHCLLVGNGPIIEEFVKSIQKKRDSGVHFVGWVDAKGSGARYGISEIPGSLEEARLQVNPNMIVISYMGDETSKMNRLVSEHYNDVIPITILPDLSLSFVGFKIQFVAGIPGIVINQPDLSDSEMFAKRIFDAVFAGIGLVFLSPVLALIACMVKISSPGPIFFGQDRIGLDGRRFKMWKFRSMIAGAEQDSTWTVPNDPRRTRLGTFLRGSSLDELPQLWNVLVGDMSLVGPRPEQPQYVEKFRSEITAYMLRHKMKAGITGWAQVNGWRGDTSLHERINCDLYYIKNWSLWLDVKILFLTFWRALHTGY